MILVVSEELDALYWDVEEGNITVDEYHELAAQLVDERYCDAIRKANEYEELIDEDFINEQVKKANIKYGQS